MPKELTDKYIETYLADLARELEAQGLTDPIQAVFIGGTAIMLQVDRRRTTKDVDVILYNFPSIWKASNRKKKEVKAFLKAVKTVEERYSLYDGWFNDDCSGMIGLYTPNPEYDRWKTFGLLEMYLVSPKCLLAQKLAAYRDKDYNDIVTLLDVLKIDTREKAQQILDKFIPIKVQFDYKIRATLNDFFR